MLTPRACAFLAVAFALPAQVAEEPTIRVTTGNVLLDVVVTDSKGNPVRDLQASDFRITQDGKARPVAAASVVELPRRASATATGPAAPAVSPVARSGGAPAQRTIAIVVDDLGLSMQSVQSVREGIRRFVDRQMLPTDRVAIIRTSGGIGALQQFTNDPALLRVAAARLRFNPASRMHTEDVIASTGPTSRETRVGVQRAADLTRESAIVGALGTLNLVVSGMAAAPGKKSVILFTDSLPVLVKSDRPGGGRAVGGGETLYDYETNPRVFDAVRRLSDIASRRAVAIHTVDAKGLLSPGIDMTQTAQGNLRNPGPMMATFNTRSLRLQNDLDGMKFVARQTGGTFTTNNNDMSDALVRSIDGDSIYYTVAYQPDEEIFRAPGNVFHHLQVKVNRPGLQVRFQSGFYGRVEDPANPAKTGADGVNLTLAPAYFQTQKGAVIDAQLLVDAADLTFTAEPGDMQKTVIETNLVTLNEQGLVENQLGQDYTLRVKTAQVAELKKFGLVYRVRHPVKRPGAFLMRAVVTDKESRRSGTATHFVEVPDIRKKALVLSNLTIGRGEETANRMFKPGDMIDYGAQVIHATGKALQREVRLYYEGEVTGRFPLAEFETITVDGVDFPVAAGRFQLSPQAAYGNYTLELTVVDPAVRGEKGRATQRTAFTVAPR